MSNSNSGKINHLEDHFMSRMLRKGVLIQSFLSAGFAPDDSDEMKNRKAMLAASALMAFCATTMLGFFDLYTGFYPGAGITFSSSFMTGVGFYRFGKTKGFRFFRFLMLSMMLLFPFEAQGIRGGFALSGSSMIWALSAPICAIMFHGPVKSVRWFAAYLVLLIFSGFRDPVFASRFPANGESYSNLFFVSHIGGISLVIFILFHYFVLRLKIEQERSESLLLNILPGPIASRLKESKEVIADGFPEATILFADIAGFTRMSSSLSPRSVVEMLNRIFSSFDLLADKFGLEKIKTIGDAYMVVGGIPSPSSNHANSVAEMALAMRDEVARLNGDTHGKLRIRIGINTGPVVAGVIGIKKFIYDLWGDAVNIASRMESTGKEDFIQVTESTWEKLREDFIFEKRGLVQVKGKGEMTTYFLISRKPLVQS